MERRVYLPEEYPSSRLIKELYQLRNTLRRFFKQRVEIVPCEVRNPENSLIS
jgi:hypothetical protein